ncbi:hypothetical protein FQZ97_984020 [compost metagenome]
MGNDGECLHRRIFRRLRHALAHAFRFPWFPHAGRRTRPDRSCPGGLERRAGPQAQGRAGGLTPLDGRGAGAVHARPAGGLARFRRFSAGTLYPAIRGARLAGAGLARAGPAGRVGHRRRAGSPPPAGPRRLGAVALSVSGGGRAGGATVAGHGARRGRTAGAGPRACAPARRRHPDHRIGVADPQPAPCPHAAERARVAVRAGLPGLVCGQAGGARRARLAGLAGPGARRVAGASA